MSQSADVLDIQIQPVELRNPKIPLLEREAGRGDGDKQTKNHQQKARKKAELEITPKALNENMT